VPRNGKAFAVSWSFVSQFRLSADTVRWKDRDRSPMVTPLKFVGDDKALVQALRAGHPGAAAAFYDQHAPHVHRTLRAVLGADADLPDLLQEVFIRAIEAIADLDDLDRLKSWLTTIAVYTARAHIRRRTRRKWLRAFAPEEPLTQEPQPGCSEARLALRRVYQILDELPLGERMAFTMRFVEGLTLTDAAEACQTSLATLKRRLSRAEKRFAEAVQNEPLLAEQLKEGTRWTARKQS
jgi:RNA polymerase sigma-70 factor, ECF subfamily